MSTNTVLKAEPRVAEGKGGAYRLRKAGRVPAIVYGGDEEAVAVSVDTAEVMHLFQAISVENTIVQLDVKGTKEQLDTLVREVQTHPFRPDILHIDFLRIQKGVALEVDVPVHLVGIPEGVRQEGGVLDQVIHEIRVKCVPSKIPPSFEVDVTALEIGDSLHVSEIEIPGDVEIMIDPILTICTVAMPRVIEEPEEELEEGEEGIEGADAEGPADEGGDASGEEGEGE